MERALDLLAECCLYYSKMAAELAATEKARKSCRTGANGLRLEIYRPKAEEPGEAMQLSWLYTIISGSLNYGRMDVYLGLPGSRS